MSVDYRITVKAEKYSYRKKENEQVKFSFWGHRIFGMIMDDMDIIERRTDTVENSHTDVEEGFPESYEVEVTTYSLASFKAIIDQEEIHLKEKEDHLADLRQSREKALTADVYKYITTEMEELESCIKESREDYDSMRFIYEGIMFHLLYIEDMYTVKDSDVILEVVVS